MELQHSEAESQTLLKEALSEFPAIYGEAWLTLFRQKLGLKNEQESDIELIEKLMQALNDSQVDLTSFFRQLSQISSDTPVSEIGLRDHFIDRPLIDQWFVDYLTRLKAESSNDQSRKLAMDLVNPKYILRNHLAQIAIEKAQQGDYLETNTLLQLLSKPFDEQFEYEDYAKPPPADLEKIEVSCSS
jgi:uncharacterized protein YdiU (UPF0061 family)